MARKRVREPSEPLQCRLDCYGPEALEYNKLREKYHLSFSAFDGLRSKSGESRGDAACEIHPEWKGRGNFRAFLLNMGPRGHKKKSIDRIDPDTKLYGPGLCRWATKKEQTRNRRSTATLTSPAGVTKSVSEWAEILGLATYDQMMAWRRNGWPDAAILQAVAPSSDKSIIRPALWSELEETMYFQYASQCSNDEQPASRLEFAIQNIEANLKKSPPLAEVTHDMKYNFSDDTAEAYIQYRWREARLSFYKRCLKLRDYAGSRTPKPVKLTMQEAKAFYEAIWADDELRRSL